MPNFESEAHYLASLTPPSVAAGVGRRNVLKGQPGRARRSRCLACSRPAAATTRARPAAAEGSRPAP